MEPPGAGLRADVTFIAADAYLTAWKQLWEDA
jgi:hypothetical protein